MSNEELAVQIQEGASECLVDLWEQVAGLVKWKANQIITALELRGNMCGVDFEDLVQCGYPAMVAAVETYKPECGAFSTWFVYYLQKEFAEATGYRTKRGQNDPLNAAFSLDKPLGDEEDSGVFGDMIPDKRATAAMEHVDEREYQSQLHEALENAMKTLPEKCSAVLRLRYYQGMTMEEAGKVLGVSIERIRQQEGKGIRRLRIPKVAAPLRPFYDFDFYCSTGLSAFRNTGLSVQERYVLMEEEQQEKEREKQRKEAEQQRSERLMQEAKRLMGTRGLLEY